MASIQCFSSNDELQRAVLAYVQPGVASDPNSDIALTYGWPINNWCVSRVKDFSRVFMPPSNDDTGTLFNETIADWDMSNATNLSSMFEGAFAFDQDISSWNLQNAISMDRMFIGAYAFDRNLCEWSHVLPVNVEVNVTDMFVDTSCPDPSDPSFISGKGFAGPFCYECTTGKTPTTMPYPTLEPSAESFDTEAPTSSSNNEECFRTRLDLELALTNYLQDNSSDSSVAAQYGWPIDNWCVSNITDFSRLFSPINNLDKATFNEDISSWDMSGAITVEGMFEGNTFFNRDVSPWKFGLKLQNSYRMFFGASSFNQDLCRWGQGENPFALPTTNRTQMFRITSCPNILDPFSENDGQPGPFCYNCQVSQDTLVPTSFPTESPKAKTPTHSSRTRSPHDTPLEPGSTPSPTSSNTSAVPSMAPPTDRSTSGSIVLGFQRLLMLAWLACTITITLQ